MNRTEASITLFCLMFCSILSCGQNIRPETLAKDIIPPVLTGTDTKWKLAYSEEFDGTSLDWDVWETENSDILKHDTYRGKENIEVSGGELKLYVTRESRNGSTWSAASIYMKDPLPRNSYVECRFRPTQCSGVNNAFWLASRTNPGKSFNNRYEIDIVETKLDRKSGKGKAHLAWHDWKTSGYAVDEKGKKCDIAQGISTEHSFDDYHTWGLWYGENEIIYYLDNQPVWNGKTHNKYADQWETGIGKAPVWNPSEEKRAYGKFGQDDWSYRGGYNGDLLNVLLSTLPWHTSSSPLTNEADGKYMAIDYVRIFVPEETTCHVPLQTATGIKGEIVLDKISDLTEDTRYYYSFLCSFDKGGVTFNFTDTNGDKVLSAGIRPGKEMTVGMNSLSSSTLSSYPAGERQRPAIKKNAEYLIVIRITSKPYGKDAVSMKIFNSDCHYPQEPYFYPNIDAYGNTSVTNEWDINSKDCSDAKISGISISGNCDIKEFRYAKNYSGVLTTKSKHSSEK